MNTIQQKIFNASMFRKRVPKLKAGMTVKVYQKIKEGEKERIQLFEGLVLKISAGYGADKTFLVRKVVQGLGVEKIFPLYSPNIEKIEIIKEAKVRRSKLYYMRERFGKAARLKEQYLENEVYQGYEEEEKAEPEEAESTETQENEETQTPEVSSNEDIKPEEAKESAEKQEEKTEDDEKEKEEEKKD